MVNAYVTPYFNLLFMLSKKDLTPVQLLQNACQEIIPAGLNSKQGPLTPGNIEFIPTTVEEGLAVDVVIGIEAYYFEDRAADIEERAESMKRAFNAVFPGVKFAVFPKLVIAGWSSDTSDTEFNGDMTMDAAFKRYEQRTGHHVT